MGIRIPAYSSHPASRKKDSGHQNRSMNSHSLPADSVHIEFMRKSKTERIRGNLWEELSVKSSRHFHFRFYFYHFIFLCSLSKEDKQLMIDNAGYFASCRFIIARKIISSIVLQRPWTEIFFHRWPNTNSTYTVDKMPEVLGIELRIFMVIEFDCYLSLSKGSLKLFL